MQEIWMHDCRSCRSFPECPCGDDNCPPECTIRRSTVEGDSAGDMREAVARLREVVKAERLATEGNASSR
jgi:hypothetical protein